MISWAVGSRSSTVGTLPFRHAAIRGVQVLMTRKTVACQTPQSSASSSWGRLCRSQDQGQARAQEQPQRPRPEDRQIGVLGENGLAQAHNLTPRDSRATIRHGGLLLGWIGLSTKDSLKSKPPPCLATRYYQQNTLNTPMNKPQGVEMELPFDSWIFESKGSP